MYRGIADKYLLDSILSSDRRYNKPHISKKEMQHSPNHYRSNGALDVHSPRRKLYNTATIDAAVDPTQQDFGEHLRIELFAAVWSRVDDVSNSILSG